MPRFKTVVCIMCLAPTNLESYESVPIGEETGFFEKFPQFKEVEPIAGVMKAATLESTTA